MSTLEWTQWILFILLALNMVCNGRGCDLAANAYEYHMCMKYDIDVRNCEK